MERRPSPTSKNAPGVYWGTACQFAKNERKDFIYEKFRKKQRLGRNGIENLCIKPTFNYCTERIELDGKRLTAESAGIS